MEVRGNNGKVKSKQKEVSAFECKKAFINLGSPVVPLLSTSKADSGLASEFRRDRAIYTAYERMLREWGRSSGNEAEEWNAAAANTQVASKGDQGGAMEGRRKR